MFRQIAPNGIIDMDTQKLAGEQMADDEALAAAIAAAAPILENLADAASDRNMPVIAHDVNETAKAMREVSTAIGIADVEEDKKVKTGEKRRGRCEGDARMQDEEMSNVSKRAECPFFLRTVNDISAGHIGV
jgi:hypothetical protein